MPTLPLDPSQISPQAIGLFVVFAVALFFIYRAVKFVTTAIMVAVASAIFPLIANNFLGMSLPVTLESILTFIVWGVGLFAVIHFLKEVKILVHIISWPFRKLFGHRVNVDREIRKAEEEMRKKKKEAPPS